MARTSTTWEKGTQSKLNHTPEAHRKRAETFAVKKMIKGEVNDYIRKTLLNPVDKHKDPVYQELLDKGAKESIKDINSPIGMYLFKEIMREGVLDMLDAETMRTARIFADISPAAVWRLCISSSESSFPANRPKSCMV